MSGFGQGLVPQACSHEGGPRHAGVLQHGMRRGSTYAGLRAEGCAFGGHASTNRMCLHGPVDQRAVGTHRACKRSEPIEVEGIEP